MHVLHVLCLWYCIWEVLEDGMVRVCKPACHLTKTKHSMQQMLIGGKNHDDQDGKGPTPCIIRKMVFLIIG